MKKSILLLILIFSLLFTVSCNQGETPTTGTTETTESFEIVFSGGCDSGLDSITDLEEYVVKSNQYIQKGMSPSFFLSIEQLNKMANEFSFCTITPPKSFSYLSSEYHLTSKNTAVMPLGLTIRIEMHEEEKLEKKWESMKNEPETETHHIISDSTTHENISFIDEIDEILLNKSSFSYFLEDCNAYIQGRTYFHTATNMNRCDYKLSWYCGDFSVYITISCEKNFPVETATDWTKDLLQLNNVKRIIEEFNQSQFQSVK